MAETMFKRWARGLLGEAMMGKDAEEFIKSDLGRYLIGRARQEAALAIGDLKRCSPWRRRRIRELQNRIDWAESFEGWLRELVATGQTALKSFDRLTAEAEDSAEIQEIMNYDDRDEDIEQPAR